MPKIYAIILAAGKGERFGKNKLLEKLDAEYSVLDFVVKKFLAIKSVDQLIVVGTKSAINNKKLHNVKGGKTRQQSSFLGLQFVEKTFYPKSSDIVIFHNAANPLVTEKEILHSIKEAQKYGAAIVAHPVSDTVKKVTNNKIVATLNRSDLYLAQTPQTFRWPIIKEAHTNKITATDEAMLVEKIGQEVRIVPASEHNKKITFQEDLKWARSILTSQNTKMGIGQDSHEFSDKKGLVLAGTTFKNYRAFKAKSDGDVILHALCNALLSGIGERSFSFIADPLCKQGVKDSKSYLAAVLQKVKKQNLTLNNVAISLEGSYPKFEPIIPQLKKNLAKLLKLAESEIGITATSGEKLTSFGQGKGIQSIVIVSLKNAF